LPAIEEKNIHHRMVLRRYHWPCMKEVITHFVKFWGMPSEPNILPQIRRPLGAVVYPDVAMALYVHGLDYKLAGVTSI
jgi:hypothetical protein